MQMKLVVCVTQVIVYNKRGFEATRIDRVSEEESMIVFPETTRGLIQAKECIVLTPRGILGWAVV